MEKKKSERLMGAGVEVIGRLYRHLRGGGRWGLAGWRYPSIVMLNLLQRRAYCDYQVPFGLSLSKSRSLLKLPRRHGRIQASLDVGFGWIAEWLLMEAVGLFSAF
jgi:hypothetical protein